MGLVKKYVEKGEKTASRIIDGEAIIILLSKNRKLCTLSPTGTKLWEKLKEGRHRVEDLLKELTGELGVDYEGHKEELLEYIQGLIDSDIIDVYDTEKEVNVNS